MADLATVVFACQCADVEFEPGPGRSCLRCGGLVVHAVLGAPLPAWARSESMVAARASETPDPPVAAAS